MDETTGRPRYALRSGKEIELCGLGFDDADELLRRERGLVERPGWLRGLSRRLARLWPGHEARVGARRRALVRWVLTRAYDQATAEAILADNATAMVVYETTVGMTWGLWEQLKNCGRSGSGAVTQTASTTAGPAADGSRESA
ncbi:MAG: hypothetical protein AB7D57_01710 [Desulfovibrionaceae bacterium]